MTTIIKGYAVKYFKEFEPNTMRDPTMNHVENVHEYVSILLNRIVKPKSVEWLDDKTCRITLPKGWTWRE